jgi:hypothetical protein
LERDLSAGRIDHDFHGGEIRESVAQMRAAHVPAKPFGEFVPGEYGGASKAAIEKSIEHFAL